ncbi:MAG: FtsX-like permease family protein [Chloroflexi bacterium]|nr:FtsX-like permease family protein [Chloroflexota bacterium]
MRIQFTLAFRYLFRRKLRTLLTTLAVFFGVLVVFGLNSMIPTIIVSLQANLMAAAGQVDATISQKTSDAFDAANAQKVANLDGVRTVSGYINRAINIPQNYFDNDAGVQDAVSAVNLIGIDIDQATAMHAYLVQSGRFLEAGDEMAAVITESLADDLDLKIGDTLRLPSVKGDTRLTIVGLLPPRMQTGNEEVLVTLKKAQVMLDLSDRINSIEVNFDVLDEKARGEVEGAIIRTLGQNYQIGVLASNSELMQNLKLAEVMLNLLGVLGLLMGGFIIFNSFRTIVAERRRDIGMLRALGASRQVIMGTFLVEGLIQGIIGTAGGVAVGYLLAMLVVKGISPVMQQFLNINLGLPVITPATLIGSIVMGIGVTLLAGLLPARQASRITPLEALRPVVGQVTWRQMTGFSFWCGVVMVALAVVALMTKNTGLLALGGVLFIVGLILAIPGLVNPIANLFGRLLSFLYARSGILQISEGNLSRQPSRTAITASTTLIAMAILVMGASMMSSMVTGFESVIRKNLGSDFLLLPPSVSLWGSDVGADSSMAESISQIDDVAVVSSLRFAPSRVNDQSISLMAIDPVTYPQVSGLDFSKGNPDEAYAALGEGRNIVVNGLLASMAGISVGDNIDLTTPDGVQSYHVLAVGGDFLNVKIETGFISQTNLAEDFHRNTDVLVQVNLKPGADSQVVETKIREVVKAYPQFRLIDGRGYMDEMLKMFNAAYAGVIAMVIFLTIPSLIAMINTLAIGVIERTREIGLLRAVGTTRKQITQMISVESLIMAGLGTAFGILSGLYLGYMVTNSLKSFGFPMIFNFPFSGVLAAIAAGILLGVVAAIVPARQAARRDIVEALRYE